MVLRPHTPSACGSLALARLRGIRSLNSLSHASILAVPDWILHVDLDQFLAAVEVLRRPELAGRPVVVGGDGNPRRPRQVVATASYEARAFGVRSGMPLVTAARRCPDAVFLPSDKPAYEAASVAGDGRRCGRWPWPSRSSGWDEAFVGVDDRRSGGVRPRAQAPACSTQTGLSCAVGIGETKLQAKTATGFAKPAASPGSPGASGSRRWATGRSRRSGASATRIAPRLAELGIHTVEQLARADHACWPGASGRRSARRCACSGSAATTRRSSTSPYVAKGRSREETFARDLTDRDEIDAAGRPAGRARSPSRSSPRAAGSRTCR